MGQDYYIWNVTKKETLWPHECAQGGKMLEHGFSGNSFLYELLFLLTDEWKGDLLFHCGDHCDQESIPKGYLPTPESHVGKQLTYHKHPEYYFPILDDLWWHELPKMWEDLVDRYVLVNYDLNIYCEIDCCPVNHRGYQLCPLPLLLSNSDVVIGGDYKGWPDFHRVGSWRYNRVGLEAKGSTVMQGMEQVVYAFIY